MSQWIVRVTNHQIWVLLESTGPAIDAALKRDGITPEAIDSLERLRAVLTFCGKRLASTDPVLVQPGNLDQLFSYLNQLKVSVDTFTGNGDLANINAANLQADNMLSVTIHILGSSNPDDLSSLSEAAASYRNTLEQYLKEAANIQLDLTVKSQANEERINALDASINNESQKLVTLSNEQQSQFSAAQDKRASDFSSTQAEYLAKYTTAASDQQSQFSSDQDARKTAFSELQRNASEKLASLIEEYDDILKMRDVSYTEKEKLADEAHKVNLKELEANYENSASKILGEIQKYRTEVESLVGVIGNLGVTSGYKKVADNARRMLYLWQFMTVASLSGLIFIAYIIAFPVNNHLKVLDTDNLNPISQAALPKQTITSKNDPALIPPSESDFYHGLITRIFLSITFGIFAAYAGRQASRFFEIELKNRKLALELEALGPFIEPLDKSDRDKFRVQIGDRSFGVTDQEYTKAKDDDPVTLAGVLKSKDFQEAVVSNVKEALKSIK